MRIERTESAAGMFLDTGSTKVSGADLVKVLARDLGKLPNHVAIANRIRPDQITQVRGFADQRLRKAATPQDPSNRKFP